MVRCSVKYCSYFKGKKNLKENNEGLKCHRFPTLQCQREKWEAWVQKVNIIGNFKVVSDSGLCSSHFDPKCYLPSQRLKKDAVPSIAPRLTAEKALKLGMISKLEEFPQFWAKHNDSWTPEMHGEPVERPNTVPNLNLSSNSCPRISMQHVETAATHFRDITNCASGSMSGEVIPPLMPAQQDVSEQNCGSDSADVEASNIGDKIMEEMMQLQDDTHENPGSPALSKIEKLDSVNLDSTMMDAPISNSDVTASSIELETSFERSAEISSSDSTPPLRMKKRKSYFGDFSPSDFKSPKSSERALNAMRLRFKVAQQRNRELYFALRRARKKVETLSSMLKILREKDKVSSDASKIVEVRRDVFEIMLQMLEKSV